MHTQCVVQFWSTEYFFELPSHSIGSHETKPEWDFETLRDNNTAKVPRYAGVSVNEMPSGTLSSLTAGPQTILALKCSGCSGS